MIVTTNEPLDAWGNVLHDYDLAAAITDGVLERGRLFHLDGPSMRTRHLALNSAGAPTASFRPGRIPGRDVAAFSEPTSGTDWRPDSPAYAPLGSLLWTMGSHMRSSSLTLRPNWRGQPLPRPSREEGRSSDTASWAGWRDSRVVGMDGALCHVGVRVVIVSSSRYQGEHHHEAPSYDDRCRRRHRGSPRGTHRSLRGPWRGGHSVTARERSHCAASRNHRGPRARCFVASDPPRPSPDSLQRLGSAPRHTRHPR